MAGEIVSKSKNDAGNPIWDSLVARPWADVGRPGGHAVTRPALKPRQTFDIGRDATNVPNPESPEPILVALREPGQFRNGVLGIISVAVPIERAPVGRLAVAARFDDRRVGLPEDTPHFGEGSGRSIGQVIPRHVRNVLEVEQTLKVVVSTLIQVAGVDVHEAGAPYGARRLPRGRAAGWRRREGARVP